MKFFLIDQKLNVDVILSKELIKIDVIFDNNEFAKGFTTAIPKTNNKFAKTIAVKVLKINDKFTEVSTITVS